MAQLPLAEALLCCHVGDLTVQAVTCCVCRTHPACRIDMETSGVLVAAKDATTASQINAQFQAKLVSKAYLALCLGVPEQHSFTVEGPIGQHPDVMVARTVAADGQPAVTHVQVRNSTAEQAGTAQMRCWSAVCCK